MKKINLGELLLSTPSELQASFPDNTTFPSTSTFKITERFPKNNYVFHPDITLQLWMIKGVVEIQWWDDYSNRFKKEIIQSGEVINISRNKYFALAGDCVVTLLSANKKSFILQKGHLD